jgi:hypothetical protein
MNSKFIESVNLSLSESTVKFMAGGAGDSFWYGATEPALSRQQADLVTKSELEQNKLW